MNTKKSMKDQTTEYYEKVGLGVFMKTTLIVLALVFGVIGLVGWYSVSLLFGVVMALSGLLTISIIYALFGSIKIIITSKELVVAFRFFSQRFFLCDIESCEQTTTSFKKYSGIGIRYGVDGSLAYSTSSGSAVRITKAGERPFVFSTNHPDTVCQIISKKITKT
jgi:hypothetical protein